jgi:hypothetical protein
VWFCDEVQIGRNTCTVAQQLEHEAPA